MISDEMFSADEKNRLAFILRKKLFVKNILYLIIIFSSVSVLVYFNFSAAMRNHESNGLLNIAFAVTLFLVCRIFVMDVLEYLNEVRSPVKKIVHTKIVRRDGDVITIGNQQFSKDDFLLDSLVFDELQAGDAVRVEHSAKSHTVFSVKRI